MGLAFGGAEAVIYGLYHSASGMLVNQYRQDVIANNLANVDTVGYKRDVASFAERLSEARSRLGTTCHPLLDEMTGGVWSAATHTDWQTGPIDVTNNPLDAAILGEGFFAVRTPEGERYTRAGAFTVDPQGRLVTVQGSYPVLNQQGSEIRLPANARSIRIDSAGRIVVDGVPAAQLRVVGLDDPAALRKIGQGLVAADESPRPVAANIKGGALEQSNVFPMSEMASMIEASRAYQINAQLLSMQDGMLGRLLSGVGRPIG